MITDEGRVFLYKVATIAVQVLLYLLKKTGIVDWHPAIIWSPSILAAVVVILALIKVRIDYRWLFKRKND